MPRPRRPMNLAGEIECAACHQWKKAAFDFYPNKATGRPHSYCIPCYHDKQAEYRAARRREVDRLKAEAQAVREELVQQTFAPIGPPTGDEPHEEPCDDDNCAAWRAWAIRFATRPL